jgi:hypothetical protein
VEVSQQTETNLQRFVVGAAEGYSAAKKLEADQNVQSATNAYNADRDRLLQLQQELIRLQD